MRGIELGALLLTGVSITYGQTSLATVTGTIADATGAYLSNAPVMLRNIQTGQIFSGASSTTGNYTVSQLPIGDYDLTVAVTGFKTYAHTRFHLAAGQTMREDVVLELGQTTESITVQADASLLKTETSEVGQNVTLSQLNNLPILAIGSTNSGFRDPWASVRLVPGIRYLAGSNIGAGNPACCTQMNVNGTPTNTYQSRLDGMTISPTGPRLITAQQETQPSVDAIEEVAIETSNFAAEFGTAGGAVINMVTKSGTNQYHGTAYDYITNEALNAHQPYTGVRNVVKQHDFGFTVGGPVWFPKIYDGTNRTFFFFSYEQFRNKNFNVSNNTTVPIPAYREGDFSNLLSVENRLIRTATGDYMDPLGRTIASGTIFDPNTQQSVNGVNVRNPFPGNIIPANRFDPISTRILALVPLPLGGNAERGQAGNNYQGVFNSSRRSGIPSIKLDQNLGARGRMSFYYQDTNTKVPRTPTGADGFSNEITASSIAFNSGQTIRLNYDYTATARLLLHFGVGWNDTDFGLQSEFRGYDAEKELGLRGALLPLYFPRIETGVDGNTAIGGMSSLGNTGVTRSFERRPSGNVSATYVTGGHTIKLGGEYRRETYPNVIYGNTQGTYRFGANMTEQPSLQGVSTTQGFDGFQFASFLLGGMSSNTLNAPIGLANIKSQVALYVQDSWKLTRKLTLDYGVRWDYGTYVREQHGRNGSIGVDVLNPSASGRPGGLQFEATCKCKFADNYPFAIGPRLGMAYQLNNRTVLRAGFGVVYNATVLPAGSSSNSASTSSLPGNSGLTTGLLRDGMPAEVQPRWPSFEPNNGHAVGAVIGMPALLDANAGRPARLLQWNIGLQREINTNLVVEASYVANRGVWWGSSAFLAGLGGTDSLAPFNIISQDTLRAYGFNDFTNAAEARLLTTAVNRLTPAQRSTLALRGISGIPYANFPTDQIVRQSLRAFPQYNNSGLAGAPLGKTWYDALQVNVTQRLSHGLSFNFNYTFSKNLDLNGSSDPFNRQLGKSVAGADQPHVLRLTAQYQVPRFRDSGSELLSNPIVSAILSDWGIGMYLSYESAGALGRPSSNGTTPISQFLGYGPGSAQLKTNADGSYMNPWSVDWVDNDGNHRTDPIDVNCDCFDPTKTIVFNPGAWENVPDGQFGAQLDSLRFFRGIRRPTENANFSRNFRIKEGISFNMRVEFNNIFNRMFLPNPSTGGNFAADPRTFTSGSNAGLYSSGFGTIVPTSGTSGMRTGQIIARLTF